LSEAGRSHPAFVRPAASFVASRTTACRPEKAFHVAFALLFLSLFLLMTSARVSAQVIRELVLVIDISTSMHDLFDEAKSHAKQFASSARLGDRVTIITFGESGRLIERSRIRSSYDIARIIAVVDELEATEYSTNLPGGMERGLREMRQFYERDPDNERILMWLSDDKNNPPKDIENVITFSSLKNMHKGKLPDQGLFEFKAPIESEAESGIEWFVDWVSRSKMHLAVELLTEDFGALVAPDLEKTVQVRFSPGTMAAIGTSFSVVAEITSLGGKPYSEAVPIFPSEIVCRGSPWEQHFQIIFPDRQGQYVCRISMVLPSDKLLMISPPQLSLMGKIQAEIKNIRPIAAVFDEVIAKGYRESRKAGGGAQTTRAFSALRELRREAEQSPPKTRLIFGPIAARGQYRVTAALTPSRNLSADSIQMKHSFTLPRGLAFSPDFRVSEGKLFADLFLAASEDLALQDGWELKGTVSFVSSEQGVKIYPSRIPVKLYARKGAARWGPSQFDAEPTYARLAEVMSLIKDYALVALEVLLALAGLWLLYYLMRRYLFGATELVGTLEVIKNPTDANIKPINLKRMGRLRTTNSLTVGSSAKADIVLTHESMADWHAKITTARTAAGGDYAFLYRCPDIQRQTIVRFVNGKSVRGVLVSWDIDFPTFEFLPNGAPSLDARMLIEFSELKAIFFVRKEEASLGERLFPPGPPASGRPVEVIFNDGELYEGHMIGEASESSKRFYIIPKERGEVALALIERSSVQNIFMRDEFAKEPFSLAGAVRNLFGRDGA